jgi:uncharacterized protein YjbI with pentapeptide repeats
MQEILTQKEFVEKYKAGQRVFDNVMMQFFDISNMKISDLTIKNSKINFSNFNSCDLKNVKFEDCTSYWLNFYTGTAKNIIFDNCDIEQTVIDSFSFDQTKFIRCNIRWSAIFNSNFGSVDMTGSTQHKFFTDASQVTPQDMEEAVKLVMHDIERLDLTTRLKIKEMLRSDIEKFNLYSPGEEKKAYEQEKSIQGDSPLTYGEVRGLVEAAFGSYGSQDPKTNKSVYGRSEAYGR